MKTLCVATDFDARLCKIRRVALSVDDDDVLTNDSCKTRKL